MEKNAPELIYSIVALFEAGVGWESVISGSLARVYNAISIFSVLQHHLPRFSEF